MSKKQNKTSIIVDTDEVKQEHTVRRLFKAFPRIKLVYGTIQKESKSFLPLIILNALVRSAQIAIAVFIPKLFIDALTREVSWSEALILILLAVVLEGILRLAYNAIEQKLEVGTQLAYNVVNRVLSEKITRLPYSDLEKPDILTLKEEASFALTNQGVAVQFVMQLRELIQHSVTILTLVAILSQLSIFLVLFLILIVIVIALLQARVKRYELGFFMNLVGVNRKFGYFINATYSAKNQQPIRLFNLEPMLTKRVQEMNREIIDYMGVYFIKTGQTAAFQSILMDFAAAISYGYAVIRVLSDIAGPRIGLGSFSLYAGVAIQFMSALRSVFTAFRELVQVLDFLEPLERFMALDERSQKEESRINELTLDTIDEIEFKDVTFTYSGGEKPVLENISFVIRKGEKISVVGLNGAGKTTLVKLLCRFFKPDSGQILVNGQDIWAYSEKSYLDEIAAVFQDYRLLPFSIQSNIASKADDALTKEDISLVDSVAQETSVHSFTKDLADGNKTLLNKSINQGATELSGGQSQKVAIARALFKSGSLVILDEPTSALDPLAEAEIYEHFDTLVQGQTAIYISHRMSSSRFCDKVLVIDAGKVTAFLPHDELVKDETSLYTRLFNEQKVYYKLDTY